MSVARRTSRLLGGVGTCIAAHVAHAPATRAQEVLFEYTRSSELLSAAASAGDWNGDGIADFAISAPQDDTVATDAGAVLVVSGADGSTLQTWYGTAAHEYFGVPVAMPDVDGDGLNELLVVSPDGVNQGPGAAYLFSGGSGTQIWKFDGSGSGALLGFVAGPTGDVDGDGAPDVFLAERLMVHIVSGTTGSLLFTLPAPAGDMLHAGYFAADLGDLNSDGIDEFLVTSPSDDTVRVDAGAATIYSGADQSVLTTLTGSRFNEQFGFMGARIGDIDGDGLRDFAITSAYENYHAGNYSSVVHVFSAATLSLLADIKTPDPAKCVLMPFVFGVGDENGDGVEDLILRLYPIGTSESSVLYSGRTLTWMYSFEHREERGFVVAADGDFDGDGIEDLLSFKPMDLPGRVRVYGGKELWLDVQPRFPKAGQFISLATREGPTGSPTVLVIVDVDGTPTFQIVGGLGTFDATGGWVISGAVPAVLSGHSLRFMAFAHFGHVVASAEETVAFP